MPKTRSKPKTLRAIDRAIHKHPDFKKLPSETQHELGNAYLIVIQGHGFFKERSEILLDQAWERLYQSDERTRDESFDERMKKAVRLVERFLEKASGRDPRKLSQVTSMIHYWARKNNFPSSFDPMQVTSHEVIDRFEKQLEIWEKQPPSPTPEGVSEGAGDV